MSHETTERSLSAAGLERRDAMREAMLDAFTAMHRSRRRRRRASAALAGVLLLAASTWLAGRLTTAAPGTHHVVHQDTATNAAASLVEIIEGPAGAHVVDFALVTERAEFVSYVQPSASLVEIIDHDRLIETLAEMKRPAGLIAVGGTVRLTQDVIDEPAPPEGGSMLDRPHLPEHVEPIAEA